MSASNEIHALRSQPRVKLTHAPTPLQPLTRLSDELSGPRIWVKRDDCTGLATGGNKTRKLEYLLGKAMADNCQQVVTFGAVQSNHARQTAAACAQLGLPCHLLLTRQVSSQDPRYEVGGNVLLDRLFGAHVELFDAGDTDQLKARLKELQSERSTCVIPAGGSNAVGALGYVNAAQELAIQCQQQDVALQQIVHASSSSGTQAGLIAGMQALGIEVPILGINVYHDDPETLRERVTSLATEVHTTFGIKQNIHLDTQVNHAYRGAGYGQTTEQTQSAIALTARLEGLLFDPVYSGKALAALIDQITIGAFVHLQDVILIHTGGIQAMNVYESEFNSA